MRGLSLADFPASLPEPLLYSGDAPALLCVWTFVHTNCLQSYTELPGRRYTACLPDNNAADTGELSCVPVIVLIVWMRKLRHKGIGEGLSSQTAKRRGSQVVSILLSSTKRAWSLPAGWKGLIFRDPVPA